jgi:predicted RND superfamily exporter protein
MSWTLEKISQFIVNLQIKYPKKFIWFFVILNLLLIPGIFNLVGNVEPSLEKVLPQNIDEIKTLNYMRSEFSSDVLYLVVYTENPLFDVRDSSYLRYLDLVSSKLELHENIVSVSGIDDFVDYNLNENDLDLAFVESLEFVSNFINFDYSFSVLMVRTNTGSNSDLIDEVIGAVEYEVNLLEEFNPGTRVEITGFSAIDKKTFSVIMSDFLVITFISMAAIMVIVYFAFGSFGRGMLPMIVVMNALLMTMGIVGYLGFTITVVSMVAAAMIMGLGIDFGIHQVYSYFEERKKKSKKDSIRIVIKELLRAMLGASLTTMAGFLALLFGVLPAMKTLGMILAIGIFTTLLGAIFLLPVIIYLSDGGED